MTDGFSDCFLWVNKGLKNKPLFSGRVILIYDDDRDKSLQEKNILLFKAEEFVCLNAIISGTTCPN